MTLFAQPKRPKYPFNKRTRLNLNTQKLLFISNCRYHLEQAFSRLGLVRFGQEASIQPKISHRSICDQGVFNFGQKTER